MSFSVCTPSLHRRMPRVALLIETTRSYTREMLAGVRRYVAEAGPWSTFIELRALDSSPPPWLKHWDGDGILTRTFTTEMNRAVAATRLPAVELRSTNLPHHRPFVGMDNRLIGQAVAEHFLNRGYRHFAVHGLSSETFFLERTGNFVARLKAEGFPCAELPITESDRPRGLGKDPGAIDRPTPGLAQTGGNFFGERPARRASPRCLPAGRARGPGGNRRGRL